MVQNEEDNMKFSSMKINFQRFKNNLEKQDKVRNLTSTITHK